MRSRKQKKKELSEEHRRNCYTCSPCGQKRRYAEDI